MYKLVLERPLHSTTSSQSITLNSNHYMRKLMQKFLMEGKLV